MWCYPVASDGDEHPRQHILIYASQPGNEFLDVWLTAEDSAVSAISIVEVLGFSGLTPADEATFDATFARVRVEQVTETILRRAAALHRVRRLKLGDSIGKVIATNSDRHFRSDDFLRALDPFYLAVETAAETFTDFTEKQKFLNIVYERFFQGFAVKQADVLGVVHTPQPIVEGRTELHEGMAMEEIAR